MTDSGIATATDPGEAFGRLASSVRVDILRALWDADGHEASFTDLQAAAGVEDSGKFNYHLGQFDGQFVERTDDAYRLTQAGVRLVGALVGGTYTAAGSTGPVPVDHDCPACGDALTLEYVEERALVDCETCGNLSRYPVPPGVLAGRDPAALPEAVQQYAHSVVERASRGFCPHCEGRTTGRLTSAAETVGEGTDPPRALEDVPMARSACQRCGHTVDTTVRVRLVRHPAVVSFHHDHGVDYRRRSVWELGGVDSDEAWFTARDPPAAAVRYALGGETLTVAVDETLSVTGVERDSP